MKVLFAVDIRNDATQVLARALPWIQRLGATVDLVFVDQYRAMLELYTPPAFRSELDRVVHEAQERLTKLLGEIPVGHRGRAIVDLTSVDEMIEARSADYAIRLWAGLVQPAQAPLDEGVRLFSATSIASVEGAGPAASALDTAVTDAATALAAAPSAERAQRFADVLMACATCHAGGGAGLAIEPD